MIDGLVSTAAPPSPENPKMDKLQKSIFKITSSDLENKQYQNFCALASSF